MTLYQKVKAALSKGVPPAQVAAVYGVSIALAERTLAMMQRDKPQPPLTSAQHNAFPKGRW